MGLKDELRSYVKDTHGSQWTIRKGQKIPSTDDLKLSNDAVKINATVLYADLAASTAMVKGHKKWFAAEVYKNFLYCAARVIRSKDGAISAYDGDRVMGVFVGDSKNSSAADCALKINYTTSQLVQGAKDARYPKNQWKIEHRVGVDTSELFVARTGIRGTNDLVWVGNAANHAAKMSDLKLGYASYISGDVYKKLNKKSKYSSSNGTNMWKDLGADAMGFRIYGSGWWRSV